MRTGEEPSPQGRRLREALKLADQTLAEANEVMQRSYALLVGMGVPPKHLPGSVTRCMRVRGRHGRQDAP